MNGVQMGLVVTAGIAMAAGVYASLRLSYVDWLSRRSDLASVERAAAMEPWNGRTWYWLAELRDNAGADGEAALREAAKQSPLDSRVWIRMGLNAEVRGDLEEAERLLLHAAEVDKLYEPRWTLMNFYFRQAKRKNELTFAFWAKEAFRMSYGDRTPLFDLCWRIRPEAGWVAGLFSAKEVRKQFFYFLNTLGELEAAAQWAQGMVGEAEPGDRTAFGLLVGRLADAGKAGRAVALWNALGGAKLDPERGASLTNGDLLEFPTGVGFDWRISGDGGVTANRLSAAGGLRIALNGKQAEAVDLLWQVMPLVRGRRYRLGFESRNEGAGEGFAVRAGGARVGVDGADEWARQTVEFSNGDGETGLVALEYRRPMGAMRAEGSVLVRGFVLELLP